MTLRAITLFKLSMGSIQNVVDALIAFPEVRSIMSLTGEYDLLVEVSVESSEELYNFCSEKICFIEGIIETNTLVVMRSWEK